MLGLCRRCDHTSAVLIDVVYRLRKEAKSIDLNINAEKTILKSGSFKEEDETSYK